MATFCAVCSRNFRNPQSLREHNATHHNPYAPLPPSWDCKACGYTANSHADMQTHTMAMHRSQDALVNYGRSLSFFQETTEMKSALFQLVPSKDVLKANGYVTQPYNQDEIKRMRQCRGCKKTIASTHPMDICPSKITRNNSNRSGMTHLTHGHEFEAVLTTFQRHSYLPIPENPRAHTAVVLGCELGCELGQEASNDEQTIIQLCLIDYFTGKTLANLLTASSQAVQYTFWSFAGPETVIVGHAIRNALSVLRIAHARIIDTEILMMKLFGEKPVGLKALCESFLNKTIQHEGAGGCLEDCLAARELAIWCAQSGNAGSCSTSARKISAEGGQKVKAQTVLAPAATSLRDISLSCVQSWQKHLDARKTKT